MAILDVLQFPDPRLRRRSEPVEKVTDDLRQLAADMLETMYDEPGIGLAAPQVGTPVRLIVVDTDWTEEGADRKPLALVNPEILEREGKIVWTEGCLSVPDFTAEVERSERVLLRALDLEGREIREEARGLRAVCFQHEIDHLDGVPLHRPHRPAQARPLRGQAPQGAARGRRLLAERGGTAPGAARIATLKLLFFGTPAFAVPTLERLLAGPHPVVAVVSQPDRPRGRGRRLSPSPVAEVAERAGVPTLRVPGVGEPGCVEQLRGFGAELGVVVAFGQFLPRRVRELPGRGYLINAHASLLPRHRGAAPIAHAILAGDAESGVSVMRIEREMDAGPVALVRRTPIDADETAGELEERLARLAADAVEEAVALAAQDRLVWTAQDPARASFAPKLAPGDARLDWREPAQALVRRVRAMSPRPGAWSSCAGERLRILRARAQAAAVDSPPGTVRIGGDPPVRVATGSGWLAPLQLQREGGRPLAVADFQRGRALRDGARLGT